MSRSSQKKVHNDRRAERRQAKHPKSVVRVRLVDGTYVFFTALILLVALAGMVVMQRLGWFETIPGAVLSVVAGGVVALCGFDLAMLLTSCITVADGQVNAGKNEAGELMVFHTGNILRVELRDRAGNPVEENRRRHSLWRADGSTSAPSDISGSVSLRISGVLSGQNDNIQAGRRRSLCKLPS